MTSVDEARALWSAHLERANVTPGHRTHCEASIREFCGFTGAADVNEFRPLHLPEWLATKPHWSPKTIADRASRIKSWTRWLETYELLKRDPFRGYRAPRGKPRGLGASPFTLDELERLIRITREREPLSGRSWKYGPVRSTVYSFMAFTGLRRSETQSQLWSDIDFDRGLLKVTRDKSRRNDVIPLPAECARLLEAWRPWSRGPRVFPVMPSDHTLNRDLIAAGITTGRGFFHRFRKTSVTLRANAKAPIRDVSRFARHTDPAITAKYYDRPEVEALREVADVMPAFLPLTMLETTTGPATPSGATLVRVAH